MSLTPPGHDPYAAIRSVNYRRFVGGWVFSSIALQMMGAALDWEIFARTKDPFALGLRGLARVAPVLFLALPAGHVVDYFDRRKVLIATQVAFTVLMAAFAVVSKYEVPVWVIYFLLILTGCARAFNGPSRSSLLPLIVEPHVFGNAVAWNSGIFQFSAMVGPLLAGFLIAATKSYWIVYAIGSAGCALFAISACFIRPNIAQQQQESKSLTLNDALAGFGHVWKEKTVLAAISLDLFAVLLGGATAMLPVYAEQILHTDAIGYGCLRAAPYVGAFVMAVVLTHRPPFRCAGPALLLSVAAYGLCTIVFGLSTNLWLSLAMLFVAGAVDNISVVIRHILVQIRTPDHLRGRVSAVNSVFIESSNELGAFESGLVARLVSPVFSVVSGGVGTLVVVLGIAWILPEVRRLRRLDVPAHDKRA